MSSRGREIASAASHLRVHWSEPRLQALEQGFENRLALKARLRLGAGLALLTVAVAACALVYFRVQRSTLAAQVPTHSATAAVVLRDGSHVEASPGAQWLERPVSDPSSHAVQVELSQGRLRLEVVHHAAGEFRVDMGEVTVEVIGTVLVVERRPNRVTVAVEQGRVKVARGDEVAFLSAGEERSFAIGSAARPAPEAAAGASSGAVEPSHAGTRAGAGAAGSNGESWQALARDGEYGAAYDKLNVEPMPDAPGDLLLAADVARLSGHASRAIPLLRKVAEKHPRDPRAALAAFTAGRVYLEDLGNPRDAALAFQWTRRLQPGGPMVEAALAREVEAWARAGETERAKALAREYLARYPQGSKRKVVAHLADEP